MTERSYFWDGIALGDAVLAPYDQEDKALIWGLLLSADRTKQGVVWSNHSDYSSMLEVTNPAGSTIRMANGAALVDGTLYTNTGNVDFTLDAAPAVGWDGYRVILRKYWTGSNAKTVRAVLLGPYPSYYPAMTQTAGTMWDLPIAEIQLSILGVVTIVDVRGYINLQSRIDQTTGPTNVFRDSQFIQSGIATVVFGGALSYAQLTVTPPIIYNDDSRNRLFASPYYHPTQNVVVTGQVNANGTFIFTVFTVNPATIPVIGTTVYVYWVSIGSLGDY